MKSNDRSQRGASAVEFAVIAPLFVALLFGIVEFGLILYTQSMLTNASREGARFGVVYCNPRRTPAEIQTVVQNFLNQMNLTSTAGVNVTYPDGNNNPGSRLRVQVNYQYQFFVLPQDINNYLAGKMANLNLQSAAVMRME